MGILKQLVDKIRGIATEKQGEPESYEVVLVKQPDGTYKGRD